MNRPDKANGMSPDFWEDLPCLVRELDGNPEIRALVISGAGKHFTGGMDLASFNDIAALMKGEPARAAYALRKLILKLQDSFNALEEARFPVLAAIHGACIGAGIDMTSACDIRLCSKDACFAIEEINIGMAADVGTLQRLPKLIAPGIVKELTYTGRRFSADEALAWGFVNAVHENRGDDSSAMALAQEIAAKSPIAIAGIKNAIDYARDHGARQPRPDGHLEFGHAEAGRTDDRAFGAHAEKAGCLRRSASRLMRRQSGLASSGRRETRPSWSARFARFVPY